MQNGQQKFGQRGAVTAITGPCYFAVTTDAIAPGRSGLAQ